MLDELKTSLRPALALTALFALLLGLVYPLAIAGAGQALFPREAGGSLERDAGGRVIGSALIGQGFASPAYFHGRPSAAGRGYDALASAGSNLGPSARALADRLRGDVAAARAGNAGTPPADLVTASASGLDPDIGPEAAFYQVARVAAARRADPARVRALVAGRVERPWPAFVGQPHVDVLALNRALDRRFPRP